MFYIIKDEKIVLFDEDKQKLQNTIAFMPQFQGLEIKEVEEGYVIDNFELITIEEKEKRETILRNEKRNSEINQKISELEQMAVSDVLQGNKENINTYNQVIASLRENLETP